MNRTAIKDILIADINWNESLSITASKEYLEWHSGNSGWLMSTHKGLFIPFYIRKHLFIKRLTFLDNIDTLRKNENISIEEKSIFLNNCIQFIKTNMPDIDFITQSPPFAVFDSAPKGSIYAPFGSYRIDLTRSETDIWEKIHSKHKNVIRKASENNVSVKHGIIYLDHSIRLINETLNRSGIKPLNEKKINQLAEDLNGKLIPYICEYNEIIQGSAIFIYSQKSALYMWGGSIPNITTGAMNLLHWSAIKDFKTLNVNCYDFVGARLKTKSGSKLEGIQRFKSRFGGTFYQGFLWKYPLTWKYYFYIKILKTYFFLKGRNTKDIIDQEIRLK